MKKSQKKVKKGLTKNRGRRGRTPLNGRAFLGGPRSNVQGHLYSSPGREPIRRGKGLTRKGVVLRRGKGGIEIKKKPGGGFSIGAYLNEKRKYLREMIRAKVSW